MVTDRVICRPAHFGGSHVRNFPASEEDETYKDHTDVVQEVIVLARNRCFNQE